VLSVGISI